MTQLIRSYKKYGKQKENKLIAKVQDGATDPINYETGIKQGNSLGLLLCNITMDDIMKKVKTKTKRIVETPRNRGSECIGKKKYK
jgi:hypothetical protein